MSESAGLPSVCVEQGGVILTPLDVAPVSLYHLDPCFAPICSLKA